MHRRKITKEDQMRMLKHEYQLKPLTIKLPKDKVGYLAGLIDGEGSITLSHHHTWWQIKVRIFNTSPELMNFLKETFGGIVYTQKQLNKAIKATKTYYVWEVKGKRNVKALLEAVIPFLVIKKKQAQEALESGWLFNV